MRWHEKGALHPLTWGHSLFVYPKDGLVSYCLHIEKEVLSLLYETYCTIHPEPREEAKLYSVTV